jgi:hypothetical protein
MHHHDEAQHYSMRNGGRLPTQTAEKLARGLGWFSIGLGAVELFGAKGLARWLGMERHETLIRAYGAREIATGIAILASQDPAPGVWARVAGDGLDLATLGAGLADSDAEKDRVGFAMAAVAGVTLLDVICAQSLDANQTEDYRYWDYSDRSGLPRAPQQMRGAARDFEVPRDMRIPDALRPYDQSAGAGSPGLPH